jgi:hypothetical protein
MQQPLNTHWQETAKRDIMRRCLIMNTTDREAQMPQGVKAPTHTKLKEDQFDTVVAVFNQVQEE